MDKNDFYVCPDQLGQGKSVLVGKRFVDQLVINVNNTRACPVVLTLYDGVKARVVKFTLPSGEIETLLTNFFDFDETEFKAIYFKRWHIEVKYDVVKNKLEKQCFGGFSENVIMQVFWISMYLANMAGIAKNEADEKLKNSVRTKTTSMNIRRM